MLAENSGSSERVSMRKLSVTSLSLASLFPVAIGDDVVSSLIWPTNPSPQETKIRLI